MATMNISLPDKMKEWVEAQTKDGKYANASDYTRDLIRKDMEKRQAIAEIQALVKEGIDSGESEPWDVDAFLEKMHKQHYERNK